MLKSLLKKNKIYQALSHAYDLHVISQSYKHDPSRYRHLGQHSVIQANAQITHPGRVWIGDWSTIQNGAFINSIGGLHVGNYVGISYRSTILTFNHAYRNAESIPFDNRIFLQPVIIRDFAWIGFNACIMPGLEIGEGAIVAMGSVVTKSVPPLAIVSGNPAEIIGKRSADHFNKCKEEARVTPHRVLETFGKFEEVIPLMTKKRYARELEDMGLMQLPSAIEKVGGDS